MNRAVALAIFFFLPYSASAQLPPDKALESFKVADGLQIELFASEPMFANPTCIDVDHKGRVWVCESVNYRCDLRKIKRNRPEGDRIVILEDTDGDGKADKAHTFYQEKDFIAPLGVAVAPYPDGKGQKVFVCHSPHIYVFEDKDGDLKADGPPKILLTGFNGYDHDHGVHGIHIGPDGKLYFSVGDQGVKNLSSSNGDITSRERERPENAKRVWTSNSTDCRAGTVWRCNQDGTNLELLAHNFRNPYEPAVNSFGTMFMSDNDDDGNQQTRICYVMYGGNYGYHPRGKGESHWHEESPGIVHKALRTGFGSPTGMCWYEGKLLYEPMLKVGDRKPGGESGNRLGTPGLSLLLHADAGPREVRCFHVRQKGAGYELDKFNLVTSTDNWFRPSDVCVAPDGSIMVADWYDPGVGGHGMGDTTRGRIYRITPKGHKGYSAPAPFTIEKDSLLVRVDSPCLATRFVAQQMWLNAANNRSPYSKFSTPANDANAPMITILARIFWGAKYTVAAEELIKAWQNPMIEPEGRPFLEDFITQDVRQIQQKYGLLSKLSVSSHKIISGAVRNRPNVSVARELLLILKDDDPEFVKKWLPEFLPLYDGQDHFYLAAINIAVGTDPKRREVILADFEKHFPEWNDKVAKLVWELRPPQVIAKLDQKLNDPKLTDAQKAQILEILAVSEGTTGGTVLLKLLAAKETSPEQQAMAVKNLSLYLPTKWSSLRKSPELKAAVDRLLPDRKTAAHAIDIITAAEAGDYVPMLYAAASHSENPANLRQAAVRGLGKFKTPDALKAVTKLLGDRDMSKEAIQALGAMQSEQSLNPLQRIVQDAKEQTELRIEALNALANSRSGSMWILATANGHELPEPLVPEAARLMRNSPYQDLRNRAMIAFPVSGKLNPNKLPEIAKLLTRRGSPEHGKELFTLNKDLGCVRCHSIRGAGGGVGPDLSMIGKKGSRENLFESIMNPDKAIADQYIQWVVLDSKGVVISGLLVEETPDYIIIRDGFAKDNKILTKNIDNRAKSKKSIMPNELVAFMAEQDLLDVVAYLETLKTPTLTFDSWQILGPFDAGQNDAGLDKSFIPETASRERERPENARDYEGKSGKISWRPVRTSPNNYVDLLLHYAADCRDTVSYLHREIESPADQEATILIGTDDGCRLWVNGELLLKHNRHEAASPERDSVKIKLRKGANSILLKINNGDGPHGFYFSIVSEQELKAR